MPVGAGSINRAARAGKKNVAADEAQIKIQSEAVESTATKREITTKHTRSESAVKPQRKRMQQVKVQESDFTVGNKIYQVTDELPIHLL